MYIFERVCVAVYADSSAGDAHFGELVAACPVHLAQHLSQAIELATARNDKRSLVELLARQGRTMCAEGDFSKARRCHETAIKYAEEISKFHLRTSHAHERFAESLWERAVQLPEGGEETAPLFKECHQHAAAQLEILTALFGTDHVRTKMACDFDARALRKLGRQEEANELEHNYEREISGWNTSNVGNMEDTVIPAKKMKLTPKCNTD